MALFDDWQAPTQPNTTNNPPPVVQPKAKSSIFNDWVLPADPERAAYTQKLSIEANQAKRQADYANKPTTILKETAKGTFDTLKNTATGIIGGLYNQYAHPDKFATDMEKDLPNIPGVKQIDQFAIRTVAPIVKPIVTDIAAAIIFNNKTLTDKFNEAVATGKGDKQAQQDVLGVFNKSATQIIGDSAQAVLGAYAPEMFGEGMAAFEAQGVRQAITANAARGAAYGFNFGLAQAASSGSKDPKEIASIILQSTIGGAALNVGISAVGHGISSSLPDAMNSLRKGAAIPPEERAAGAHPFDEASNPAPAPEGAPTPEGTMSQRVQSQDIGDSIPDYFKEEEAARRNEKTLPIEEIDVNKIIDEGYPSMSVDDRNSIKSILNDSAQKTIKVYRAGNKKTLQDGDFVALDKAHAEKYLNRGEGREIIEQDIPKDSLEFNQRAGDFMYKRQKAISKLARQTENVAIQSGLVDHFSDLPEYNKMNIEQERGFANDLIKADPERAMRVAMGDEPAPQGVRPAAVYRAVEDAAVAKGDVEVLRKLAVESKIPTSMTIKGQEIRLLGDRDSTSPVQALQDIKSAREMNHDAAGGKKIAQAKADTVKEIRAEVEKTAPKKQSWEDFIQEIKCNY